MFHLYPPLVTTDFHDVTSTVFLTLEVARTVVSQDACAVVQEVACLTATSGHALVQAVVREDGEEVGARAWTFGSAFLVFCVSTLTITGCKKQ